uniref:Uncharacterized protein n=1 Tax=Arundo donax TaxID=35708 RepID=A0A0A8YHM6_ARUDO
MDYQCPDISCNQVTLLNLVTLVRGMIMPNTFELSQPF